MRRIYLESLFGLVLCFILGVIANQTIVYNLNTDYDYVLEDYVASAHQQLIAFIAENQGLEAAQNAMKQYVDTSLQKLTIYNHEDKIPSTVLKYFDTHPDSLIFHDEERDLWFRLAGSNNIYYYAADNNSLVRQKVDLEEDLVWVFILASFIVYTLGYLMIIFRRVKKLEAATLRFAEGDLSSRADTKGGSALGTLNKSFNLMADRIHNLIESNRSLTNAVAHELRTPIFRIQWQAEVLKDTPLNNEQKATIESIVDDTEEMEKMVDELLYYAKLDCIDLEKAYSPIEVSGFLDSAVKRWKKETGINIKLILKNQSYMILADETLLNRALDNLVRNGMKFAYSQILIIVKPEQEKLLISVHDDGDGVAKEHQSRLFEPFYVGDKARNKAKSGHGLGLSIVDKICTQHGALVNVGDSEILKGAVFTITFPLCNDKEDKHLK
ncbi:histidine kinase [Photobacterium angustum]|uniref:sensor histidine kinase n=1 Tax=Photobacterium angustum TaxID=661 RepID=UPI0005E919AC|nr:ATP-binding protein [Photobacterium angustum]KJG05472.1 histidine kinase [Photobacterium angustum]PSV95298.1 HAMP domain-containing protein [Photobacterium angustum]PSW81152.1 HAMP domain-containing protein [Photobacterium angustum]